MHYEQTNFCYSVRLKFPDKFRGCRVLDIGSQNVNGDNRQYFENPEYVGIDLAKGANVDIICPAKDFKAEPFDVIISTEHLEHDKDFILSLQNAFTLLKPGGLFLFTCAGHTRPEHGTKDHDPLSSPFTTSYYQNIYVNMLPDNLELIFSEFAIEYKGWDLYMYGIRR